MNWIVITEADLKVGKAAAVVNALASAALGSGQADPTAEVIAEQSKVIRGKIGNSGKYLVSATTNAIPPSLKSLAIRLILWTLGSRLNTVGGTFEPNEQEKIDHRNDLADLAEINRGEGTVETPDDPLETPEVQAGGFTETVQEGNSGNSRDDLQRL